MEKQAGDEGESALTCVRSGLSRRSLKPHVTGRPPRFVSSVQMLNIRLQASRSSF